MNRLKKVIKVLHRKLICMLLYINGPFYMRTYVKYLRRHGMDIKGMPNYFSNDVHFDGKDYGKIHIGDGVTVSREVLFLTHDYAAHTIFGGGGNSHHKPFRRRRFGGTGCQRQAARAA